MASSSSYFHVDMDEEIAKNPKKTTFNFNARKQEYMDVTYSGATADSYKLQSVKGTDLSLKLKKEDPSKEYTVNLTNVSPTADLYLGNSSDWFYGSVEEFYYANREDINWFENPNATKVTGTPWGDSISAGSQLAAVTVNSGAGCDTIIGSDFNDNLTGGSEADSVFGGAGNDNLNGEDGSDMLVGEAGNDKLLGGLGNDTLVGGLGNDTLQGGAGENTYVYEDDKFGNDMLLVSKDEIANVSVTGGVSYNRSQNGNDLVITNEDNGTITVKDVLKKDVGAEVIVNGENLKEVAKIGVDSNYFVDKESHKLLKSKYTGTTLADSIDAHMVASEAPKGLTLDGGAGNDSIIGSQESDKILGGLGDDTLVGGLGNDTLQGGAGENTYVYGGSTFNNDTLLVSKDEIANVSVVGGVSYGKSKNGNDLIITNDNNGTITVKDVLKKDTGAEIIVNGKNLSTNKTIEVGTEEFLQSTGGSKPKVNTKYTGTTLAEVVDARGLDSYPEYFKKGVTIDAGAGNDTIYGTSNGGKLLGGAGDDYFEVGSGNTTVSGGTGVNTSNYADRYIGEDTYLVSAGETLNLNMTSVPGYGFTKSANGNDLIVENGEKGSVTLKDYLKKDVGAEVIVNGHNLSTEKVFDVGTEAFVQSTPKGTKVNAKYTGTTVAEEIDASGVPTSAFPALKKGLTIDGGAGNDSIYGSATANDKLYGGAGDDYFEAGSGNTTIVGGSGVNTSNYADREIGNDTYLVSADETLNINMTSITGFGFTKSKNGNDLIVENGSKGTVTIKDLLKKDVGAEVYVNGVNLKENAVLGVVGEEYFNPSKGKPNNKYTGTAIADVVDATEYHGASSSYSYPKGVTIDGGAGNDSIVGSAYCTDKLAGGVGDDTIVGGYGGMTSIIGGAGNDVLSSDGYSSQFVFNAGDGNDSITAYGWNNSVVFANGTDVEVGYSDQDLLITYSGVQNKQEVVGTVTVKDFDIYKDLAVTVGKTTRPVLDYLAEDNTHSVSSFNSDTALLIYETGGIDTLNLAADADDVRPIMNVYKDGSYSTEMTSFVHTAVLSGETPLAAFEIGVQVSDVSSGTGIEKVNMNNDISVDTDFWYDKVAQEVSGWLSGTSYDSTMDALNAYEQDPSSVDLSGLVAAYNVNQFSA